MEPDEDRVLRASVPDRHKGATSPIGAAQSYIAELERALDVAGELGTMLAAKMRQNVPDKETLNWAHDEIANRLVELSNDPTSGERMRAELDIQDEQ